MKKALWLGLTALLITASGLPIRAEETNGPLRFLFLIDTSRSMARLKKAMPQIVQGLVASGFQGRIEPGERFGIWTFSDQVFTNQFPPKVWTQENGQVAANDAAKFLGKLRFANATRMDKALVEMRNAVAASPKITILLLTDGEDHLAGTPFDRSINGIFMEFGKTLHQQKKPFVVVFQGEAGILTAWRVHTGGPAITFPDMPDPLRQSSTSLSERFITNIVLAPKTNPVASRAQPAPESPKLVESPKPIPPETPKVASVESAKNPVPALGKEVNPVATALEPPLAKKFEPPPVATPPVVVSKPEPKPTPPVKLAQKAPEPPLKSPAPKNAPKTLIETRSAEVKKTAPLPPAKTAPVSVPEKAHRAPMGLVGFAIGGGGLLAVIGIAYLFLKPSRKPTGPSLISRSIDGDGKQG